MGTTVRLDGDGGDLLAVKEARGPGADRLAAEAAVLERAGHPGLVEVVAFERDGERARLVTRHVGTHSLATAPPREVERVAAIAAAVATTLADLHALGMAHGRLQPSHVLLDRAGRPVLCSPSGEGRPSDDVAALGDLLAGLLDGGPEVEPIPDRRLRARRWRGRGPEQRGLLNLADLARCDPPERRPTARALATAIADLVPGAGFERAGSDEDDQPAGGPGDPPRPGSRPLGSPVPVRPIAVGAGALVGVLLLGAGLWSAAAGSTGSPADPTGPTTSVTASAPAPRAASTATAAPTEPAEVRVCDGGRSGPLLDVDGDGCADPVVVEGGIVSDGRHRWAVAAPDEPVAVGDWDCDGVATAAVLRPATGEVFVFEAWAGPGDELAATRVAAIDGATSLAAVTDRSPGCHRLEVRDRAGRTHHPSTEEPS